ncbi:type I restriction endonuclease subunit R [Kovacikia minuta CCNUW1]|uniref:type I restriction endonuclease subunit R n=1 Tax=Kovacikia minuta TaxID=2931930 RepID=UPI001CCE6E12|nr:type I restriction endonuclease subunit R [Kovacikia minuta]UBF28052.1 type I restriction endonuclease subunit R [Kovacikia minuta CCNUW1]
MQAEDDQFFTEWRQDLPDLTEAEKATLDKYHQRYLRHREQGELSEGTVKLLLVFPLLELAGFYDEPFFITTEPPVEITVEDQDEVLRGRIDTLVVQQDLWVPMVESKRSITFSAAIPQALTYMMANPHPDRPVYGMATDGDLFMFIKLLSQNPPQYDFSEPFSLFIARHNKLHEILQILKHLAQLIV